MLLYLYQKISKPRMLYMFSKRFLIASLLLSVCVSSILLPHPISFTGLNAATLFMTTYLKTSPLTLPVFFLPLIVKDLVFGFHSTMYFVYLSVGLTILIESRLGWVKVARKVPFSCLISATLFFVITNFGVWATTSLYDKTISGLGLCYMAALPFYVNQLLGDLFYCGIFYYSIAWINATKKETSFSLAEAIKD